MKTLLLRNVVAGCFLVTSTLAIKNTTSLDRGLEKGLGRAAKTLGIFSVVRFPNDICTGSANLNGTCYTSEECSAKAGTSSGTCASGFGVCCTFSLACGSTTTENNTYHEITTFSSTTDTTPCTYEICQSQSDVCKLRVDFSTFSIYTPWTSLLVAAGTQAYVPQGIVVNVGAGEVLGECLVDTFTVTGSPGSNPPSMCGLGSGQHMYIDISDTCAKLNFNIDTTTSFTRSWSFTSKQILCSSELAKHSCMQYFTGTSGTFASWNYDTTITAVAPAATVHHLNDQHYDICFRRESGYCRICYDTVLTTAAITGSFGISAGSDADGTKSAAGDTACDGVTAGKEDYIEVGCAVVGTITTSLTCTVQGSKLCGAVFNSVTGQTTLATACSYQTPFKWGVHFDDGELILAICTTGIAANACENQPAGGGGIGFHMNWWQETC